MIIGIGTDICEIKRIQHSIDRYGMQFTHKILTKNEIDYCYRSTRWKYESVAARFAAKEAFYKAWPQEKVQPQWHDIEIKNLPNSKPYFSLSSKLEQCLPKSNYQFHLSLSHEKKYAIAYVCIEKK